MTKEKVFIKPFFKKRYPYLLQRSLIRDENTIYGGYKIFSGCTWLKQVFYSQAGFGLFLSDESLTLSDLKKDEVLKLA